MTRAGSQPVVKPGQVIRLWLWQQGLLHPRRSRPLTKKRFIEHLERVSGLQLDPINVVERAHYLTLWSRYGRYNRSALDRWVYRDRVAFEYWCHEASLLPLAHLPLARRRMMDFPPPSWKQRSWWSVYQTSGASKRRVLRRLREQGPLESSDFEQRPDAVRGTRRGGSMPLPKEDGRSLKLLWHSGRVAVHSRRNARLVYDLAERIYPEGRVASRAEYEDSWLMRGLEGNGVVTERHLANYITGPTLSAAQRRKVLSRALKRKEIVQVRVAGLEGQFYAKAQHLDMMSTLPEPSGTTLICPFDSFLWQRRRAEELLGFRYRIEIYLPPAKREFGYYVLPIMHRGELVGRVDPKMHREDGTLEIRSVYLEHGFVRSRVFVSGLREAVQDLAAFLGAERIVAPKGWRQLAS